MLVGTVAGLCTKLSFPSALMGLREKLGSTCCPVLSRSWRRVMNSEKGLSSESLIEASRITLLCLKVWELI